MLESLGKTLRGKLEWNINKKEEKREREKYWMQKMRKNFTVKEAVSQPDEKINTVKNNLKHSDFIDTFFEREAQTTSSSF